MSFDFKGQVLRAPRIAPSNANTTAEVTDGVIRTVEALPAGYDLDTPDAPPLVDVRADQYRAAILDAPGTSPVEYCVWAENSSNIALRNDPTWAISKGKGAIPVGALSVTQLVDPEVFTDGSSRIVVTDDGNRSIGTIAAVVIARGDTTYSDDGWVDPNNFSAGRKGTTPYEVVIPTVQDTDVLAGVVKLDRGALTLLGGATQVLVALNGGVSNLRGDTIVEVQYALSPARFWWTRNDRYQTRFGWSAADQRWEPYKGGHVSNLGKLEFGTSYSVSPKPRGLLVGTDLPGSGSNPDAYSMIRLGTAPGAVTSVGTGAGAPLSFTGIKVKNDRAVTAKFDFTAEPHVAGVIGKTSGLLVFNPTYIEQHAGKFVWFVNRDFDSEAGGIVGNIFESDKNPLYISPIPGPTDFPLLSLGSRHYLTAILVVDEAALGVVSPTTGEVAVALTTGRLKLSQADIDKSNVKKASFSKHFLGEKVLYGGLALNAIPQPVRKEVAVVAVTVSGTTKHFLPDMTTLPTEWVASDPTRGLGVSGVIHTPDNLGVIPTLPMAAVPVRAGGDDVADVNDGRVRRIFDGVSDTIVFSRKRALSVRVVDTEADLPSNAFSIPSGIAYITRENVSYGGSFRGSRVLWGSKDALDFGADPVYFLQADFCPAVHTTAARLLSKSRFVFRFPLSVTLYFALNGTRFEWVSSANLSDTSKAYTAEEVSADINTFIGASGTSYALNGSVVIETPNPLTDSIEIGWGDAAVLGIKDLAGAANLGFVPGHRVVGGVANWLPDSGISFGMTRSPVNQDRTQEASDFNAYDRLADETLAENIVQSPFVFLDAPPLQDVAGIDQGVFFNLKTIIEGPDGVEIVDKSLGHYDDIVHRFGERKFLWAEQDIQTDKVEKAASTLGFGRANLISESLLGAAGIEGGLFVATGGAFVFQDPKDDFLLPDGGVPGNALLIERFGNSVMFGGRGSMTAGTASLTDPDADFTKLDDLGVAIVQKGYRLKVPSGPAKGSYVITAVAPTVLTLDPTPPFSTTRATPWEIFKGFTDAVFDPALVVDQGYKSFNHLPVEPMVVRTLSNLGTTPANATAQTALRLKANMEAAITRKRTIDLRFGFVAATAANTTALTSLTKTLLGSVANNTLIVPSTNAVRFAANAFQILVGTDLFTATAVASFATDPGGGAGIEYLQADGVDGKKGLVKFGTTVLKDYGASAVHYVETFLAAASLTALNAEYDPGTGHINLSAADMVAHTGLTCWFVEQMITEDALDVSISPMAGACGFNEPVKESQAVEFEYDQADEEGRKVLNTSTTEFLPVIVRDQVATRITDIVYEYNTLGREMDLRITPTVYVGAMMQNYGPVIDMVITEPATPSGKGLITFLTKKIPSYVKVKVSFASFEANGGERAYTASKVPIYRPPFFVKGLQDNFGLRTDRTADFVPGQMLRIGNSCHYIRRLLYLPTNDITRVDIFPPTVDEIGSRAPGNDVLTLVTAGAITTSVDPDGATPVATGAPLGFMQALPLASFPFEPVEKGQKTITFQGDLTKYAVPGHILEVAGMPFTIAAAKLNEDGTRTKITTTAAFSKGVNVNTTPTVKLTYRPVYPPNPRDFLGLGPVLETLTENSELVLFGEVDTAGATLPGRTLVRDIGWGLDTSTGAVRLLEPVQKPLGAGQRLSLSHTRIRTLKPFLTNGVVGYPRTFATFLYNSLPSQANGLLGGLLSATYTFRSPDTFYCRATTLSKFLGEAVKQAVDEIKAKQPAGGAIKTVVSSTDNWQQGRLGLLGTGRHLKDQDRAARTFLDFYNTAVVAFEQIPETISGGFIGDRDGKFRFFLGKGKEYPTPGYEDAITGRLTSRFVWADVFNLTNPFTDLRVLSTDKVTDPFDTSLTNSVIDGPSPDADLLNRMVNGQRPLVRNDVDDEVLVGVERSTFTLSTTAPFFLFRAGGGDTHRMSDAHRLSRLFPTQTKAFLISYPGLGANEKAADPGVFARSRTINSEEKSTYRTEIGQLANPALGNIENVTEAQVYRRRARARIWGYFPNGITQGQFASVAGGAPADLPAAALADPCVVAFPTLLSEVPLHPTTGYPDVVKLLSDPGLTGTVPDLNSGDPSLATPGFVKGDQINWGTPDGKRYAGLYDDSITIAPFGAVSITRFSALFVRDITNGCIIRFQDKSGNPITDSTKVLVGTAADAGTQASDFPVGNGDTIYVVPATGGNKPFAAADAQNPTTEEMIQLAARNDTFDVAFRTDGKLIDNTLPSFFDPTWFGLKEIFGQNPVPPLTHLEGDVDFVAAYQNPTELPCLKGEFRDDTGDFQIPYLKGTNTELERFTQIAVSLPAIISDVYPDEIFGVDGEVVGQANIGDTWDHISPSDPLLPKVGAALMSVQDMAPKTTSPAVVGLADLRSFDLLLVEVDSTEAAIRGGSQGILSVGSVVTNSNAGDFQGVVKPPRFVTMTTPPPRFQVELGGALVASDVSATGSPIRYKLDRYFTFLNAPAYTASTPQTDLPVGVKLQEIDTTPNGILDRTIIDFDNAAIPITLHDGLAGAGLGGLNDLWENNPADNEITIQLYARTDPAAVNGNGAGQTHGQLLVTFIFKKTAGARTVEALPAAGAGLGPIAVGAGVVIFGTGGSNKQIYINVPGIIDWGPAPGTPAQWYLPYIDTGAGAGRSFTTIYGFEFTCSVDCSTAALAQSTTGWINSDRLTFRDVVDMSGAMVRGTNHPQNAGTNLETELQVFEVTTPAGAVTVNDVNGGTPFTFLPVPSAVAPFVGATWAAKVAATSPEFGTLEVPAFEGDGDIPILSTGQTVRFAGMPTSTVIAGTLTTVGAAESASNTAIAAAERDRYDNRVTDIDLATSLTAVERGDILCIDRSGSATHWATTKSGSWPIRYAVTPDTADPALPPPAPSMHFLETSPEETMGPGGVMLPAFPLVKDKGASTLSVDTTTGFTFPGAGNRVYVVLDPSVFGSAEPIAVWREGLWSATHTGITTVAGSRVFNGLAAYEWADGQALTATEIASLPGLSRGKRITGFTAIDISVKGTANSLPEDDSVVGWHNTTGAAKWFNGVRFLDFTSPGGATTAFSADFASIEDGAAPGAGVVAVEAATALDGDTFDADPKLPLYPRVPIRLHFNIGDVKGDALNNTMAHGGVGRTNFIIPNTLMLMEDTVVAPGTGGFAAQGGIFLEAKFPQPTQDLAALGDGNQHVVDSDHSLVGSATPAVGHRNFDDFIGAAPATPETVHFTVRRCRRWHDFLTAKADFLPLRYAYEIRRGIIQSYTATDRGFANVDATAFVMQWNTTNPASPTVALAPDIWNDGLTYTGTNLGAFNSPDVNINPGDMFRHIDDNGVLIEQVEIASVSGPGSLKLAVPGLAVSPAVGDRFEVWLRQAPVPHEQSMEQLLDLVAFKDVHRTWAEHGPELGGYSPANTGYDTSVNKFFDDHSVTGVTFAGGGWGGKGVKKGDIIVIDPAGTIPQAKERGEGPLGDRGVNGRAGFSAGSTDALDDNRGFYRISAVNDAVDPPQLTVNPVHSFAGTGAAPVVFPGVHPNKNDVAYAVLPTVELPGWTANAPAAVFEGQNDLRPSKKRSPTASYQLGYPGADDARHSIRPVSYQIIRPNQMFSDEAVDFILTVRERMKSWIEVLTGVLQERRLGPYFTWMRDNHSHDLDALGLMSNAFVQSLVGHWEYSPYMNSDNCLSLLGRRFWIHDPTLDRMEPTNATPASADPYQGQDTAINPPNVAFPGAGGPYTAYTTDIGGIVRPVLPDRVEEVLDNSDRLRPIRYIWLAYRTHRLLGTLASLTRFEADLPQRLEEQRQLALLQESTDKAETG